MEEMEIRKEIRDKIIQLHKISHSANYDYFMGSMDLDWAVGQIIEICRQPLGTDPKPASSTNTISSNKRAKRWAMMNFDKWNEVTGFVDPHTSYYDEITALIEDAVEFGYGVALKQPLKEILKVIKKSEGSL